MSTESSKYPGARWWKFEFHTHSPASLDFGKGLRQQEIRDQTTPEEWLLAYMRAGIDCVAITDHNNGDWVDKLKAALEGLKTRAGYRPLYLFPGVEISASGGVHILALFSADKTTADITQLLGAVGYRGTRGNSDAVTERSLLDVVTEIHKAGGLALPAHVDESRGLFAELSANELKQLFECHWVIAIELRDSGFAKPASYERCKLTWTEVLGSDAHHLNAADCPSTVPNPRFPGSHFSWVKMDTPSFEGLRLALLDGSPMSIRRSDENIGDPNRHAENIIEEVSISEARYSGHGEPLRLQFNPWLNSIIGGRGSGKSTVVEFMRLVLRREKELTNNLAQEFADFARLPKSRDDKGALQDSTAIKLIYRKGSARYRIHWLNTGAGVTPTIEEERAGAWVPAQGDIAQRFKVRLFSQRQVFAMAEQSEALLRIVDESEDVRRADWDDAWQQEETKFLSLTAKTRELAARLAEEAKVQGELDDVLRRLKVFEGAQHARVLKDYQRRQRQKRALAQFTQQIANVQDRIRELANDILPADLDVSAFDSGHIVDQGILLKAKDVIEDVRKIQEALQAQADAASQNHSRWNKDVQESLWALALEQANTAYGSLTETLRGYDAGDPTEYSNLVQRRQLLEQKQKAIADTKKTIATVQEQAEESLKQLQELRRKLIKDRRAFLNRVLKDNPLVRITLQPYGRTLKTIEAQFRRLVNREDEWFASDILTEDETGGFIAEIYRGLPGDIDQAADLIEKRWLSTRRLLLAAARGGAVPSLGQRFVNFLTRLAPEVLDRLRSWQPEDSLAVEYSPRGDGKDFRSVEQGSPGQKTAAILAFVLAYGDEPIVLDQPEDDLDNHLIYDLIVRQLRNNKLRRQIIVVTHNPNIVVNGDAEMVFAMDNRSGQCWVDQKGSLQEGSVREEICRVMEGGKEAFAQRYRRIAEGDKHV
jgi:energy-coupling factor transporter ATP-binding protein EcfA2